jgi:hypothetical protein
VTGVVGGRVAGSDDVWLVWGDRGTRALLFAQCVEEGWEAAGYASPRDALAALAAGRPAPRVVVVAGEDAARDPAGWAALRRALGGARVVAVRSRTRADVPEGADVELARPLDVAAVVDVVRRCLGAGERSGEFREPEGREDAHA